MAVGITCPHFVLDTLNSGLPVKREWQKPRRDGGGVWGWGWWGHKECLQHIVVTIISRWKCVFFDSDQKEYQVASCHLTAGFFCAMRVKAYWSCHDRQTVTSFSCFIVHFARDALPVIKMHEMHCQSSANKLERYLEFCLRQVVARKRQESLSRLLLEHLMANLIGKWEYLHQIRMRWHTSVCLQPSLNSRNLSEILWHLQRTDCTTRGQNVGLWLCYIVATRKTALRGAASMRHLFDLLLGAKSQFYVH